MIRKLVVTIIGASVLLVNSICVSAIGASRDIQPRLASEFLYNGFWAVLQVDTTFVCAMDGGISVLTLDADIAGGIGASVTEEGVFRIRDFFPLEVKPISLRYDNATLVVQMADNSFLFFSISESIKFTKLGEVDFSREIQDYLYHSGALYFAEEFRGLSMYRVDNFSSLSFVDSSMVGVRVVQLALEADTLYALDDYNGILRYPAPATGLQPIPDYLYLPFQIQSFTHHGDRFNLAVGESGIKTATFDSLGLFDSLFERPTISFAAKVFETDSNYVIISSPNVIETQDKADPGALNLIPISGNTLGATLANFGDKQVLVTPSKTSGLAGLWMNVSDYPQSFASFDHPGPIQSLHLVDGFLYTAGRRNSFEKYKLFGADGPELVGSRSFPLGTNASVERGDTLYLIDNGSEVPLVWVVQAFRDSLPLALGAFGVPVAVDQITIHEGVDGGKEFLLRAGSKYYLIRTDVGELFNSGAVLLSLGVGVTAVTVERERIYHYSSKTGRLSLSKLSFFDGVVEISSLALPGAIKTMLTIDNCNSLLMFSEGRIRRFDIRVPDELKVTGEYFVAGDYSSAVERDGLIFAVGPNSTGVLAFVDGELEELYYEPSGASLVSAGTGVFATSNGTSIKVFEFLQAGVDDDPLVLKPTDFRLLDNYPNPFNGETLIRFSGIPSGNANSRIVVYNVLGQVVRELALDGISESGASSGEVRWDGRNESGAAVASGMYFARLLSKDFESRRAIKMIYLK
ncbi:T9SS type A sorting domain-containing protein [bacterium AH-315-J21]|nr:T9SS type A sorting domain-containing protein [bacterium AH-315-J21]